MGRLKNLYSDNQVFKYSEWCFRKHNLYLKCILIPWGKKTRKLLICKSNSKVSPFPLTFMSLLLYWNPRIKTYKMQSLPSCSSEFRGKHTNKHVKYQRMLLQTLTNLTLQKHWEEAWGRDLWAGEGAIRESLWEAVAPERSHSRGGGGWSTQRLLWTRRTRQTALGTGPTDADKSRQQRKCRSLPSGPVHQGKARNANGKARGADLEAPYVQ